MDTSDQYFDVPMMLVGVVSGQVLDKHGNPTVGGDVVAYASIKLEQPIDAGKTAQSSARLFRLQTKADGNGRFRFDQLPAQIPIWISLASEEISRGTPRSLDVVTLQPGERHENNVYRP